MIPTGREFYLECAKLSNDRKYRIKCFRNFVRVMNKEQAPASTGAKGKDMISNFSIEELGWQ